ncbi:MAG: prepilin peptidase [bacterium]
MILAAIPPPYAYSPVELSLIWGVYLGPLLLALVFGLIVGSFINVVAWRSPRWRSLLDPPSHCYSCGTFLEPKYNVPVFGYLKLKGTCAYCGSPYSSRYMWIELLTGVAFTAILFIHSYLPDFPMDSAPNLHVGVEILGYLAKAYVFTTILIIIAVIDTEFRYIFPTYTVPGMILGLLTAPLALQDPSCVADWTTGQFFLDSFYGLLLGAGLIGLLHAILPRGMGSGDVMLAGMLGAFLGWKALLIGLWASVLTGGIAALLVLLVAVVQGRYKFGTLVIPYGPYLAIGALIGMLFGCQWFDSYWGVLKGAGGTGQTTAQVSMLTLFHGWGSVGSPCGCGSERAATVDTMDRRDHLIAESVRKDLPIQGNPW